MPLGRSIRSITRRPDRASAAIVSRPCAIASMRSGVSVRRSMKEDLRSLASAPRKVGRILGRDQLRVVADCLRPSRQAPRFLAASGASASGAPPRRARLRPIADEQHGAHRLVASATFMRALPSITRSSRWTISSRPLNPSAFSISLDLAPGDPRAHRPCHRRRARGRSRRRPRSQYSPHRRAQSCPRCA